MACDMTLFDFARGRPDVSQIYGLAVFAFAQGILAQVDVDAPGERKSDDQRRRHQIVGAHFGVNAAFKVAIATENRGDDKVVFVDALRYFFGQRAGVADAGRASVADDVEFQFLEIGHQARGLEVVADDFRTRRERSLDPRGNGEAFLHRFLGEEPGADQDRRIRSVGARRDGGDNHAAVLQGILY